MREGRVGEHHGDVLGRLGVARDTFNVRAYSVALPSAGHAYQNFRQTLLGEFAGCSTSKGVCCPFLELALIVDARGIVVMCLADSGLRATLST